MVLRFTRFARESSANNNKINTSRPENGPGSRVVYLAINSTENVHYFYNNNSNNNNNNNSNNNNNNNNNSNNNNNNTNNNSISLEDTFYQIDFYPVLIPGPRNGPCYYAVL